MMDEPGPAFSNAALIVGYTYGFAPEQSTRSCECAAIGMSRVNNKEAVASLRRVEQNLFHVIMISPFHFEFGPVASFPKVGFAHVRSEQPDKAATLRQ
jgi:hypothetical protein